MGVSPSTQQPIQINTITYSSQKPHSKSRRIFNSTNKQNKTKQTVFPLNFSQINSIEQNHVSRPSESMMNVFSSRLVHSLNKQKINLDLYQTLSLSEYQYEMQRDIGMDGVEERKNMVYHGGLYTGGIREGKLHGKGVLINDYQQYQGWFRNGVKHGHGREISSNQVYEGQYFEGRRKGNGVLYTKQQVFQGQFYEVFIKGSIKYKDGRVFEGEMDLKQKRIKKGTFQWPNGIRYQGEFKNNLFVGPAILIGNDKSIFQGYFENGLKKGKGIHVFQKQDQKYEGEYLNNKRHGPGKFWFSIKNNHYFEGEFRDDKPHGEGVLRTKFGEKKVVYQNGILKHII